MASEYEDRKRLTFEQAEGAEPLPSQLKLREVSPELRARLWRIFHRWLTVAMVYDPVTAGAARDRARPRRFRPGPVVDLLFDWHVTRRFGAADEFGSSGEYWTKELKAIFMAGDY